MPHHTIQAVVGFSLQCYAYTSPAGSESLLFTLCVFKKLTFKTEIIKTKCINFLFIPYRFGFFGLTFSQLTLGSLLVGNMLQEYSQRLLALFSTRFEPDCLVGLVVKASVLRVEDPWFDSRLRRDFFRGPVIPVT